MGIKYGQIIKMQVDPIAINQPPRINIFVKIEKNSTPMIQNINYF